MICERQFAPSVLAARSGTAVEHVVCVDGAPEGTAGAGRRRGRAGRRVDLEAAWRAVEPGDVATLIFTSGTTGPPKGVELTHANLLAQVTATLPSCPSHAEDRGTSYLPSAHIADRWLSHYQAMVSGHQTTFIDDMRASRRPCRRRARPCAARCRGCGRSSRRAWRRRASAIPPR